jgi:hypothetical protein
MMDDAARLKRFRQSLMVEIENQPAMTPQGLADQKLGQYALSRRFSITKKGHFGLAPKAAKKGDKVVVLLGADVPFIMRKVDETFQVVGEAYIDGIMHGEAVKQVHLGMNEVQDLVLS